MFIVDFMYLLEMKLYLILFYYLYVSEITHELQIKKKRNWYTRWNKTKLVCPGSHFET